MNLDFFFKHNTMTDRNLSHLNEFEGDALCTTMHLQLFTLLSEYGGSTIDNGLFRLHNFGSSYYWTQKCCQFFEFNSEKLHCFGFDWMGKNYALDRIDSSKIYMFDYEEGEYYTLEQSLLGFLNVDLVEHKEDTLSVEIFEKLNKKEKTSLTFDKCFSFKTPLFLGGEEVIDNYKLANMEVSWELNFQLLAKIKDLPEGTIINNIAF
jgi:Domain of unknown function (DUF1851)